MYNIDNSIKLISSVETSSDPIYLVNMFFNKLKIEFKYSINKAVTKITAQLVKKAILYILSTIIPLIITIAYLCFVAWGYFCYNYVPDLKGGAISISILYYYPARSIQTAYSLFSFIFAVWLIVKNLVRTGRIPYEKKYWRMHLAVAGGTVVGLVVVIGIMWYAVEYGTW